ncbi:MAG TPA: cyanophycinase [Chloroflexia bacterium]|nr:cyanophycinase [Chloroflexia bacterium]
MSSTNGRRQKGPLASAPSMADAPWELPGYLMIIGGADRLDHTGILAKLFLQLVERAERHSEQRDIVLITTATRHPEILKNEYVRIYTRHGYDPARIHAPLIRNHDEAMDEHTMGLLDRAAGIFITGGDQYALTQVLDRTRAEKAIMAAYGRGAVVAGTSAGATAMGRPMVVAGGGTGELRMGMVQMSNGLGWAGDDLIIDTHFGARGRFPRLTASVAEHPAALGVGIDENTCLLLDCHWRGTVKGTGVVYFVDASHAQVNTAHGTFPGTPISVGPLEVAVLSSGGEYDMRARRVLLEMGAPSRV